MSGPLKNLSITLIWITTPTHHFTCLETIQASIPAFVWFLLMLQGYCQFMSIMIPTYATRVLSIVNSNLTHPASVYLTLPTKPVTPEPCYSESTFSASSFMQYLMVANTCRHQSTLFQYFLYNSPCPLFPFLTHLRFPVKYAQVSNTKGNHVHSPTIAQHPTNFQAHNIPTSHMGFHIAPPPMVSIPPFAISFCCG